MQNRRSFLKRSSLIALTPTVPSFLANFATAHSPVPDDRVLVVIQLDGGNDGVNTVVPFTDEGYARHRKELFIPTNRLLKLDDQFGLHPEMRSAAKLWEDGRLAIVPSVGYPNPNRSHDASLEIWQTCRFKKIDQTNHGWLGRSLDQTKPDPQGAPGALAVGGRQMPVAIQGRKSIAASLNSLEDYVLPEDLKTPLDWDAFKDNRSSQHENDLRSFLQRSQTDAYSLSATIEQLTGRINAGPGYPVNRLGQNLKTISSLLKAGFGTRVFYTFQGGYDTHANQGGSHGELLSSLTRALKAFLDDLKAAKLDDRVLVLCFSEFGRRVDENGSAGTDHGSAGLTLLAGKHVAAGLHGGYSSLTDLDDGGLKVRTDFRSIYASILDDWLNVDSKLALGKEYPRLSLVNAS